MAELTADCDPVRSAEVAADFDAFYAAEWPGALRLATLLTQQTGVAEDLAQEAFARVVERWHEIERPGAYLHTTLVNVCRRWQRRRKSEELRLPYVLTEAKADPVFDALAYVLADLPYRQRAVIVLRYYADLSEAEIAEALDCRPGTVKSLASRALSELRRVVDQ